MTEANETIATEEPAIATPIVVNSDPVPTQINTFLRDLGIVAAALPTLVAFFGKRDVIGFVTWLSSAEALPFVGVVAFAAITIWRQFHARKTVGEKTIMGKQVDDNIAIVK